MPADDQAAPASKLVDERIEELGDWRVESDPGRG